MVLFKSCPIRCAARSKPSNLCSSFDISDGKHLSKPVCCCSQLLEGARLSERQQEAIKAVRRRYLGEVAVLASRRDELEAVLQQVGCRVQVSIQGPPQRHLLLHCRPAAAAGMCASSSAPSTELSWLTSCFYPHASIVNSAQNLQIADKLSTQTFRVV